MTVRTRRLEGFSLVSILCVLGSAPANAAAQPCDDWTQRAFAAAPHARFNHGMCYDSGRGRVVVFGGRYSLSTFSYFGDTWEWDGNVWTRVATTGPAIRVSPQLAYDSVRQRVVLYGGYGESSTYYDTWEWNGSIWQLRATSGPQLSTANSNGTMVFDSARARTVLFDFPNSGPGQTWEWDGTVWVQKFPATRPTTKGVLAYDAARQRTVHFGQQGGGTWEWDGTNWLEKNPTLAPPPRISGFAMAFHPGRARVILHGGMTAVFPYTYLGDTWEFDGTTWTQFTPATSPEARRYHTMAYDTSRQQLVLFGGTNHPTNGQAAANDLWELGCPPAAPCYANCDQSTQSPVLNVADFTCFLQKFAAGCP